MAKHTNYNLRDENDSVSSNDYETTIPPQYDFRSSMMCDSDASDTNENCTKKEQNKPISKKSECFGAKQGYFDNSMENYDAYFDNLYSNRRNFEINDNDTHVENSKRKKYSIPGLDSSDDEINNIDSFLPSDVSDVEYDPANVMCPKLQETKAEDDRDELIDDIFGDDDGDEFEGFNHIEPEKEHQSQQPRSESTQEIAQEMSDFDKMMQRVKSERKRTVNRKRKVDVDLLNENDDIISVIVNDMKISSDSDRTANRARSPGISKLRMLPYLVSQLQKKHVQPAFIECGFLLSLAEWLAPLPDGSLPTLKIRNDLLPILEGFPIPDSDRLKSSGIGKAVMYLYKSSQETRENKIICKKIMDAWCRPLFNLSTDYNSMDREERKRQDNLHARNQNRRPIASPAAQSMSKTSAKTKEPFYARARVPTLSTQDYVNRPVSAVSTGMPLKKKGITSKQRLNKIRQKSHRGGAGKSLSITKYSGL